MPATDDRGVFDPGLITDMARGPVKGMGRRVYHCVCVWCVS